MAGDPLEIGRLCRSHRAVRGAVHDQKWCADLVGHFHDGGGKAGAGRDAASGNGRRGQTVWGGSCQSDGDETTHAMPVGGDALAVHVRQACENLQALERAADILFAAKVAAEGTFSSRPGSRPQRTAVVRVVGRDAHHSPLNKDARLGQPKALGAAAQAVADENGRKRAAALRLEKDAVHLELLIPVSPLDAIELEAGQLLRSAGRVAYSVGWRIRLLQRQHGHRQSGNGKGDHQ